MSARASALRLAAAVLVPLLACFVAGVAHPDLAVESVGRVERLPERSGPHWFWLADVVLSRIALFDADSGKMLGMLSAGSGLVDLESNARRHEIYLPETHYARRTRGERTDVVTVYDASTLAPLAEVVIPPRRGEHASGAASTALSDDGRFLAVFNLTPATSLTIVDLAKRRFSAEVATPGCSLVYGAGGDRFIMLCGNGELLSVRIDARGRERDKRRSEPLFDPDADPITEKAVRYRDQWLFVSFGGRVHPVDVSSETLALPEPWSLLSEADREQGWRIGGAQHLALHTASARLYSLVHRGGPDSHKDPGTEVWVYDLSTHERVGRIALRSPFAVFLRQALELSPAGWAAWLLERVVPNPGVERILVTQDEAPVLLAASAFPSTLQVYDARSGSFLRDIPEPGLAGGPLRTP